MTRSTHGLDHRVGYNVLIPRIAGNSVDGFPDLFVVGLHHPPDDIGAAQVHFVDRRLPGFGFLLELGGDLELRGFRIVAGAHYEGFERPKNPVITARLLREVKVDELRRAAEQVFRQQLRAMEIARKKQGPVEEPWPDALGDMTTELRKRVDRSKGSGRPRRSMRDSAMVALVYEAALASSDPVQELARQLHVKRDRASELVRRARSDGFLTPPPKKGMAGGHATPEAKRLIEREG